MVASTSQTISSPFARSSATHSAHMGRPSSPIHSMIESACILAAKALGPTKAEEVFGSSFNATISETSAIVAACRLVPIVGTFLSDTWHDAKVDDLNIALNLIKKNKEVKDFDAVFKYQLEAANLHHVDSMVEVGKTYFSKGDIASAHQWLYKAATIYHQPIAYLYLYKMWNESEPEYALTLLDKARDCGCIEYFLEWGNDATYSDRFETTHFLAALGHVDSMIIIAKTFSEVENDKTSALKWLEKAVSAGSVEANFEIFKLLENSNIDKAFYSLNWAAEGGHQQAIEQLVAIYENAGFGYIRPNPHLANEWKQKLTGAESKQYSDISTHESLYKFPVPDASGRFASSIQTQ